ncbi:MAG: zinc-dependent metalloprotease, partial [Planctomycetota bacterium]
FSLDEIDSQQWRDEGRPLSGSVMDYNAINYHAFEGGAPGSCFMSTFGPYDAWAIRYGYADDDELEAILGESTQPEHAYLTDEDLYGPDPTARYRDLGGNALDFVDQQMALVERLRGEIAQRALEDGKTYQRARDAYMTLLWKHASNLATAARYVGGVYVRRDRVGNAERNPTEVVPAEKQRRALGQVVRWAFTDEAFGLKPELLDKMSYDKWMDTDLVPQDLPDPQLDVHDLILGVQASTMTALFNPTRLRRIYDNEQRLRSTEDAFTLAELFGTVQDAVWSELDQSVNGTWSARAPFVSSLRRNLQREQLERMIDLALSGEIAGAAQKSVASLTALHLRRLGKEIRGVLDRGGERLDVYSLAHLEDVEQRIEQALNAIHVYR